MRAVLRSRSSGAAGPEDSGARERESGAAVAGGPERAAVARGEEEEDRDALVGVGRQARVVQRTAAGERSAAVGAGRLGTPVRSRFC